MAKLREKVINEPVLDLVTLKSIEDALADNGILVNVVNLGVYKLDKASTLPADDFLVVETYSGIGRWLNISNWQGTPTVTIGGIQAGVYIPSTPVPLLLEKQFKPYQAPAFTAFALSGFSVLEIGAKITGNQDFTWAISNVGNVQPNSIYIKDVTNNLTLVAAHSVSSPATYNFNNYGSGAGLGYSVPTTNVFQIQATNTESGSLSRNVNTPWYAASYSGANANASLNNAEILALANKVLLATFPPTAYFAGGNTHFWYWIPTDFVQPNYVSGFRNLATGLSIAMEAPVTQTVININGTSLSYKGYRSTELLTNPINVGISS